MKKYKLTNETNKTLAYIFPIALLTTGIQYGSWFHIVSGLLVLVALISVNYGRKIGYKEIINYIKRSVN